MCSIGSLSGLLKGHFHTSRRKLDCAGRVAQKGAVSAVSLTLIPRSDTAVGLDSLPDDAVVTGDRRLHELWLALPKLAGAFDVGEQERKGSRLQIRLALHRLDEA